MLFKLTVSNNKLVRYNMMMLKFPSKTQSTEAEVFSHFAAEVLELMRQDPSFQPLYSIIYLVTRTCTSLYFELGNMEGWNYSMKNSFAEA